MKYPGDKLQLIRVLSLGEVLQSLEAKTRVEGEGERHDAEVSYREGLARLADGLGEELIKLVEEVGRVSLFPLVMGSDFCPSGEPTWRRSRERRTVIGSTLTYDITFHGRRLRRYLNCSFYIHSSSIRIRMFFPLTHFYLSVSKVIRFIYYVVQTLQKNLPKRLPNSPKTQIPLLSSRSNPSKNEMGSLSRPR
jgi:hypothetical protein